MALETKAILSLIASGIAKSKTVREAYDLVAEAATTEGVVLKTYDEAVTTIEETRAKDSVTQ